MNILDASSSVVVVLPPVVWVAALAIFTIDFLFRVFRSFFKKKKDKIVLTYSEFKDLQDKVQFKDKIND